MGRKSGKEEVSLCGQFKKRDADELLHKEKGIHNVVIWVVLMAEREREKGKKYQDLSQNLKGCCGWLDDIARISNSPRGNSYERLLNKFSRSFPTWVTKLEISSHYAFPKRTEDGLSSYHNLSAYWPVSSQMLDCWMGLVKPNTSWVQVIQDVVFCHKACLGSQVCWTYSFHGPTTAFRGPPSEDLKQSLLCSHFWALELFVKTGNPSTAVLWLSDKLKNTYTLTELGSHAPKVSQGSISQHSPLSSHILSWNPFSWFHHLPKVGWWRHETTGPSQ